MKPARTDITLGDRLTTYGIVLKQLDVVLAELETTGFVTIADRDRWEKLIIPERARVGTAMKSLGISALSRVPSLGAVNGTPPSPPLPPAPKPFRRG